MINIKTDITNRSPRASDLMGRFKRVLGKLGRRAESHQDAGVPMPCVKIKSSSSNSLSTQTPSNAPVQSSQLQSDAGKPSARKDNLWLEARDKISCDDRESIKEFNPQGSGATELNVRSMVLDLQQKGEACKAESWKFRVGNHTANFQDAVNTALRWVDKVKGPIDIAVSADPVHAALPWAGIKFLILVPFSVFQSATPLTFNRWLKPTEIKLSLCFLA